MLTLKLGMTLDGRIADGAGRSRWITSGAARDAVDDLRSRADAIMVGAGTACADDPALLCRRRSRRGAFRVIVDSTGRLPLDARVLNDEHRHMTIIATTRRCPARRLAAYRNCGAAVWVLPAKGGRVSLRRLMTALGRQGLLHAVCEGGGELACSLIADRLVDEFLFFLAPRIMGGGKSIQSATT